ncbi:MAG: hypothetical protein IKK39_13030 [Thermoguttaceae bacterium]|nr:hypothetical protein [Thermoguttaceae bacterium]MBR4104968.1 hypothetical protein [Thermoguttaceae bacterium]
MKRRVRIFVAVLSLSGGATFGGWTAIGALGATADESCLWGAPGGRTTYLPPYDPSDAPTIPLLKRPETAVEGGTRDDAAKKNAETSLGPRVGDSGTFVGADGKTYYYCFVEGVRRRAFVETRPDASSPSGWRKVWRYVDEPRLIKQIWPTEPSTASPEPCRPVENGVETENASPTNASAIRYRATARVVVP